MTTQQTKAPGFSSRGFLVLVALLCGCASSHSSGTLPRVFQLDARRLAESRRHVARDNPALLKLKRDADAVLTEGPFSVVDKKQTPPSGDKHDYMSLAPYWWPNRDTPDGLPYVHRDGERNPEIYKTPNRRDLGE